MKRFSTMVGVLAITAGATSAARDARACGACFSPPSDNTVVSGHRMVMAVSKTQTTLWDQIKYTGNPSSFAWVLPVRGAVSFGLSGEIMFQTLDSLTTPTVGAPPLHCPDPPPGCHQGGGYPGEGDNGAGGGGGGFSADAGAAMDAGVVVVTQQTVGPYEMVQLSSTDATALETWLGDHGYAIPADMKPVIAAYVAEGFDFLALKLVPGQGVETMRPVRVTTPGGGAVLPLRMVAGGTGVNVPITLWVMSESGYETQNFETFKIDPAALVWDFATYSSNAKTLRDDGYAKAGGTGWLDEVSIAFSPYNFRSSIDQYISMGNTDYAPAPLPDGGVDPSGGTTASNEQADLDQLFAGMMATNVRVTRLRAELPRTALGVDLQLRPAADQSEVPTFVQATKAVNIPPCPDWSWCAGVDAGATGGGAGSGAAGSAGAAAGGDSKPAPAAASDPQSSGCGVAGPRSLGGRGALLAGGLAALAIAARRRRAHRAG